MKQPGNGSVENEFIEVVEEKEMRTETQHEKETREHPVADRPTGSG